MAKRATIVPPEDQQQGLPPEDQQPAADEGETTLPEGGDGEVEPPVEPPVEPGPLPVSAYEQAVAFQPDPWDQLPEDPEVRELYLAINGHLPSFFRHRR